MSRPDLCFDTSSFRKSLSRRCRFSIASSTVNRGRTPRNSATSPRHGFRSTMIGRTLRQPGELDRAVHRDGRRAGAALGAEEHVRDARLARCRRSPRRAAWRCGGSLRGTTPPSSATAPWRRPGSTGRTRSRRRASPGESGRARLRSAIAKIATDGPPARSRSIAAIPDETSARMSTMTRSGPAPSMVARPSVMPTGTPHARIIPATCCRNSLSCVTICTVS